MKKITSLILAVLTVAAIFTSIASAMTPYITYTYSIDGEILESPDAYVPDNTIDSDYIGLEEPMSDLRDVEVDDEMNVYITDAGQNRILVLDRYYKYKHEIATFVNEHGVPDSFSNPAGVFASKDYIYVCDSSNSRIVMFDRDYNYVKSVQQPSSALFEQDDIYSPIAVAVDSYGRMFVVSSTTYQGIIVMDEYENFYGFIGAQSATVSAMDLLWRKFMSAQQISQSEQIVSTEYKNIDIDDDDFIYATVSSIDESTLKSLIQNKDKSSKYAPVKKFNANGIDIMYRNGFYPPAGEVKLDDDAKPSLIIDAAVGPNGTWSIIDERRSKIFTYNYSGELLFAFGDNTGSQTGNVKSVEAIAYQGSKMLVLDKGDSSLAVYRRTEYGDILMKAIVDQDAMNFDAASDNWKQILKRNNNFDIAYIGIGKYYHWDGEYETAMSYFKAAHDTSLYSDSYEQIRTQWLNKWFWTLPLIIVGVLLLISKGLGAAAKRNKRAAFKVGRKTLKEELCYICHLVFHPFDGFWDLKHERRGSVRASIIIILVTIFAFFYQSIGTGYIFSGTDAGGATIFSAALSVLVPLMLWVVSNWCLTTLLDGEGSFKDVFIATSYSIAPLAVFTILSTLCSNVMVAGESTILTLFNTIAFGWLAILLFFGTMITHGYSMAKNVCTILLTVLAMAFLMFLALLFSSLMGKIVSFIAGIVTELNFRL